MEPKKTDLAPLVQRLTQAARYVIGGVKPDTWMSPGQPVAPAEPQIKGRAWDYSPGRNLWLTPRAEESIGFAQLRNLAKYCDLVRIAIETRKDQICATPWEVVPKDGSSLDEDDPRVQRIRNFIRRPDGRQNYASWARQVLEDMFVIDAPCVYARPNLNGDPWGLEIFDGATIKPLIDEDGRTPMPPDPAYQQIIKGIAAVDFTSDELLYLPRNPRSHKVYGYSPVEQIVITIDIALRRQTHKLQYYTEGSRPDLAFQAPDGWTPQQISEFYEWFQSILSGNTAQRQKGVILPHGSSPINLREQALKDDYDEWLARIVMYCFSLPPTPFIKQHSRANDATQQEVAEDEGLLPLLNWWQDFWNIIIEKYLGEDEVEFRFANKKEIDPQVAAQIDDMDIKTGKRSIDEVRVAAGLAPVGIGLGIITGSGFMPLTDANMKPIIYDVPEPTSEPANPLEQQAQKLEKAHMKPLDRQRQIVGSGVERVSKILADWLKKAGESVAKQAEAAFDQAEKADSTDAGAAIIAADSTVTMQVMAQIQFPDVDDVAKELSEALQEIAKDGAGEALKQVSVSDVHILATADDKAVEFAHERGAELVGKRWVGDQLIDNPNAQYAITQSTRDMLRGYVEKAVKEGWTGREFSQNIQEGFPFSEQRANVIARTEVAKADVEGSLAGWRESGVVTGTQWLLSNLHPKADICDDNAAVGINPLNQPYPSGDMGPPAHPMCACGIVPIVEDR